MDLPFHTVDLLLSPDELRIQWWGSSDQGSRLVEPLTRSLIDRQRLALEQAVLLDDPDALAAIQHQLGQTLFALLDGPEHALQRRIDIARSSGQPLHLVLRLRSTEPHALAHHPALGWHLQLLTPPSASSTPLALQPHTSLTVQLGDADAAVAQVLPTGHLQLLHMACSPSDVEPVLDYEAEEERILDELAPFAQQCRLLVHFAEEGSLAELRRRLSSHTYDVVHLAGHGILTVKGPRLLMEDELGVRQEVSPEQLLTVLRAGHAMPRLVVLSSCHTAEQRADLPSMAAALLLGGVPCVVGWTRPVGDGTATVAAVQLYHQLCSGQEPPLALAHARQFLHAEDLQRPRPTHAWTTLQLLTTQPAGFRLCSHHSPPREQLPASESTYLMMGTHMRVLERGFVGRRRELQALSRVLRRGVWASGDQAERTIAGAVVIGMKGQGKSCLVGRAVQRHLQDTSAQSLIVLHGPLDELTLAEAFRAQAVRLRDSTVQGLLSDGALPLLQRLQLLLRHHWREHPLVIILDDFEQNLDIPAEGLAQLHPLADSLLRALVPACLGQAHKLLITSTARFALPDPLQGDLAELELGSLEGSSVRKLWMRGQHGKELSFVQPSQWTRLAERLGRNARLLDWARQLLGGKTPQEVHDIATRAGQHLPAWSDSAPDKAQQDALVSLFLKHMALDQAQDKMGPQALTFIERARVYEEPVPAEAFAQLTQGLSVSLDRHLLALANLGLLEVGRDEVAPVYRVSPLVKEVFDAPDGERWHSVAATYWWTAAQHSRSWNASFRAWRHALQAKQQALADEAAESMGPWLDRQGHFARSAHLSQQHVMAFPNSVSGLLWAGYALFRAGHPRQGLPLLQRSIELAHSHSTRHPRLPEAQDLLARVLGSLGEHAKARQQLEELVAAEEQAHPAGSLRLCSALHVLAGVLHAQGDLPTARALLERSLRMSQELLGTEEHPNVSATLHTLAGVLQAMGELPSARSLLERSLQIDTKRLGTEQHPSVAASLHALAEVFKAQGNLTAARSVLERALHIRKEVLGTEEHPDVAASLHELAIVSRAEGDLISARALLERALRIKEQVLRTEQHPDVVVSLHALAGVLQAQGDLPAARSLLERSLRIRKSVFGTDEHPDVSASLHELARVLQAQNDLPTARAHLERALHILEKVHGTQEHPAVAASLHQLADVLRAQGDLHAARSLLEQVLHIDRRVLGTEEHHDVAVSYVGLADCLRGLRLFEESEVAFLKALALYERVHHTRDHYMIAEAEIGLAFLLLDQGRQAEALPLLQHSMSVLQAQVPNHPLLRQLQGLTFGPSVDPNELAHFALSVRRKGRPPPEELLADLRTLRSAGEPHDRVADFLEQLARGGPLPLVPPGLPEDITDFVAAVRQAAEEDSFEE